VVQSYLTDRNQKIEIKSSNSVQSIYSNWGTVKYVVPQSSILGPLLFIIYIDDLSHTLRTSSIPIIFADDTSVITSCKNFDDFCMLSNKFHSQVSKCFSAKLENVIKFITTHSQQYPLNTGYNDKYIEERVNTTFLGLQIDNRLNWTNHIEQFIPKVSRAYCAVRVMLHISNTDTLKTIDLLTFTL
jgi:hypothetical protein